VVGAENLMVGSFEVNADLLYSEDFASDVKDWKTEGRGKMWVAEGRLVMDASGVEITAWCPFEAKGDLLITYQAGVLEPEDANNIDLFFLAAGSDGRDIRKLNLSGAYEEYQELPGYIMTFTDGYTQLRRDPDFQLVSENRTVQVRAGFEYHLAILLIGDQIRCFINDVPVHAYTDQNRHRVGRIALRSRHTRLWWDNLKVFRVLSSDS